MSIRVEDSIKLNREVEELAEHGIHQGCIGVVIKISGKRALVIFHNPIDFGDNAWAWADLDALDFFDRAPEEICNDHLAWAKKQDPAKKLSFEPALLQEYDLVEVTVEKAKYAKEGIHKGMQGTILLPIKSSGKWYVVFFDEVALEDTDIWIHESDLKLISRHLPSEH